jgi:RHS repeat-associated protein
MGDRCGLVPSELGAGGECFGGIMDNNGRLEDSSNWTDPHNHYLLSGKEWDEELGLYYFGARTYDAALGVWLTQDVYRGQVEQPLTLHRMLYAAANPVNNVDACGYAFIEADGGGASCAWPSAVSRRRVPAKPKRARIIPARYHLDCAAFRTARLKRRALANSVPDRVRGGGCQSDVRVRRSLRLG